MRNLCVALLVFLLLSMGCRQTPTAVEIYNVEYQFTGTAEEVFITYLDSQGKYQQKTGVSTSWAHTANFYSGNEVYFCVQNLTPSGTVRVKIFVNGYCYKSTWSEGAYATAMVQGILE